MSRDPLGLTPEQRELRTRAIGPEGAAAEEAAHGRAAWARQLAALARIITYDPADYVPLGGPDRSLPGLVDATRVWLDKIERELDVMSRLHLVK
jgi:hypothetical protein